MTQIICSFTKFWTLEKIGTYIYITSIKLFFNFDIFHEIHVIVFRHSHYLTVRCVRKTGRGYFFARTDATTRGLNGLNYQLPRLDVEILINMTLCHRATYKASFSMKLSVMSQIIDADFNRSIGDLLFMSKKRCSEQSGC